MNSTSKKAASPVSEASAMLCQDAPALLEAIQAVLIRIVQDDGPRITPENAVLLRRAAAGLGWLRYTMRESEAPLGTTTDLSAILERARADRAALALYTSGQDLEIAVNQKSAAERLTPSPEFLTAHIRHRTGQKVQIDAVEPVWSPTSKEVYALTCGDGAGWPHQAIMRREPPIAIVETSLADEFDVLKLAYANGLSVPRPLFAEADPAILDGRFLILERVPGRTMDLSDLIGRGDEIARDMATFLARLHALNAREVPRFAQPSRSIREQLAVDIGKARAACTSNPSEIIHGAFDWLFANLQSVEEDPAIVHGDFDLRNMMIHEGRLSAVLDWELSICGHPAQDLGYVWPHITQISSWDKFMAAYTAAGGRSIPLKRTLFFVVWSQLWRVAIIEPLWRAFYRSEIKGLYLGSHRYLEQYIYLSDMDRALSLALSLDSSLT